MQLEQDENGFFTNACNRDGVVVGKLRNVHRPTECEGRGCAIHNHPSDHALKDAKMSWEDGMLERICMHHIGHPDHDSTAYLKTIMPDYQPVHACDGCCS